MFSLGSPINEHIIHVLCRETRPLKQGVNLPLLAFYLVAINPRGYMDHPISYRIINLDLTTKNVHIFPLVGPSGDLTIGFPRSDHSRSPATQIHR
jgi:hypothetical protein